METHMVDIEIRQDRSFGRRAKKRTHAIFPEEGKIFVAIGAALYAEKTGQEVTLAPLIERLRNLKLHENHRRG